MHYYTSLLLLVNFFSMYIFMHACRHEYIYIYIYIITIIIDCLNFINKLVCSRVMRSTNAITFNYFEWKINKHIKKNKLMFLLQMLLKLGEHRVRRYPDFFILSFFWLKKTFQNLLKNFLSISRNDYMVPRSPNPHVLERVFLSIWENYFLNLQI